MTAAPGDALVAPPSATLLEGYFPTNQRASESAAGPRAKTSSSSVSGSDDRSTSKCMGVMSRRREQLNRSSHSTIALLAETSS